MENEIRSLYKVDSKGKVRNWIIFTDGDSHFTRSGLVEGKKVQSGATVCFPKNVGKINETSPEEQALLEAESSVTRKIEREGYFGTAQDAVQFQKFSPTLAKGYQDRQEINALSFPYLGSQKLDGIRCYTNYEAHTLSRKNKAFLSCVHLYEEIKKMVKLIALEITKDTSMGWSVIRLDGELYNHELKDNFEKIVSLVKKQKPTEEDLAEAEAIVEYHIFDFCCLSINKSAIDRYNILKQVFAKNNFKYLVLVDQKMINNEEEAETFKNECKDLGFEGAMLKCPESPYETKRTENLLKYKDFYDAEYEIVCFTEGKGNWAGAAKSVTLKGGDGDTFKAGIKGSMEYAKQLLIDKDSYVGKMATIRYQELTSKNKVPRFGRMVSVRDYE
tara:strand:- start:1824 stop:2987 length:1164 start_codon:yes stop_codon:yes gene_type:complete